MNMWQDGTIQHKGTFKASETYTGDQGERVMATRFDYQAVYDDIDGKPSDDQPMIDAACDALLRVMNWIETSHGNCKRPDIRFAVVKKVLSPTYLSCTDIARRHNVTKQRVDNILKEFYKAFPLLNRRRNGRNADAM